MRNYIKTANLNIYNGLLQGTMEFGRGLNIISGENGTLKTRLLQALRSGHVTPAVAGPPLRMQAISPKRNSERRAAESILQHFRQHNRTWEATLSERLSRDISDANFDNYPSLGDLFYLVFEHRCKDGADRREHMVRLTDDLNRVLQSVFPHYALVATWDNTLGAPRIAMRKRETIEFPIESLSLGEQEIMSLVASIDVAKDNTDVYLIDEPEVHLNWHLEERLFAFLDDLCEAHEKQAIVVTHSRTIFKPRFLPKAQFLFWSSEGKVAWGRDLTADQKRRLAGDAVEIIALGEFTRATLFVEDGAHSIVLRALADAFNAEIRTSECGNSSNVKSLYRYQKAHGGWSNTTFLIDGDNQGNPYPDDEQFVHLPVYSIENVLLDPDVLASISGRTADDIRSIIVAIVRAKRSEIFRKTKFFEFLAEKITEEHITFERLATFDGSIIIDDLAQKLGMSVEDLALKYMVSARDQNQLQRLIPERLLAVVKGAAEAISAPDGPSDSADQATSPVPPAASTPTPR